MVTDLKLHADWPRLILKRTAHLTAPSKHRSFKCKLILPQSLLNHQEASLSCIRRVKSKQLTLWSPLGFCVDASRQAEPQKKSRERFLKLLIKTCTSIPFFISTFTLKSKRLQYDMPSGLFSLIRYQFQLWVWYPLFYYVNLDDYLFLFFIFFTNHFPIVKTKHDLWHPILLFYSC